MKLIEVENITKRFQSITALEGVTFTAYSGQIKSIIGPNGAGKTTLFNIISGLITPDEGRVIFREKVLNGLAPHERARLGIGRTFQKALLFSGMSVWENVLVIAENVPTATRRHRRSTTEVVEEALRLTGLFEKADWPAELLTAGERHLLELARALALEPDLLLLDEPAAGLNDAETEALARVLFSLKEQGKGILLVEHDMKFVMSVSDEVVALHQGRKIAEGPPLLIQEDRAVIEAYLGSDIHA